MYAIRSYYGFSARVRLASAPRAAGGSPTTPDHGLAEALYARLCGANPASFAAYVEDGEGHVVLSASPERFLRLDGRQVETSYNFV